MTAVSGTIVYDSSGSTGSFSSTHVGGSNVTSGVDSYGVIGYWLGGSTVDTNGTRTNTVVPYIAGIPNSGLPTSGTASYSLAVATPVFMADGTQGTLSSSVLSVTFPSSTSASLTLVVSGGTYAGTSTISNLTLSSGGKVYSSGSTSVSVSCTTCTVSSPTAVVAGGLVGAGGARAGLVYGVATNSTQISSGTGAGYLPGFVGAAAYKK